MENGIAMQARNLASLVTGLFYCNGIAGRARCHHSWAQACTTATDI
jgi:hypothetical protein